MSVWLDRKYLLLLSPKLSKFSQKNTNLFNFRCPFCGDSKNISKSRGYVYVKKNKYFFKCFNCDKGSNLRNLLEYLDPFLTKEYLLESYKDKISDVIPQNVVIKPKNFTFKTKPKLNLPTIASLSDNHFAKEYVRKRKIPESSYFNLYYAEDFSSFIRTISNKNLKESSSRLIIPFFSKNGELIAVQGRALDDISLRYITIKINQDLQKIFGADRIDKNKPILVCEGPLDSLFLPNAIATADSNLSSVSSSFNKDNLILIPDNEPRNLAIVNNIEKFINANYKVCLFPKMIKGKDINEMIMNGVLIEDLLDIINKNTFSGLRAKLEFSNWKLI